MQEYAVLLAVLVALLVGLTVGKAHERYKLVQGRWTDRRRHRHSPHFILGLNHLVAGQVDLAIEQLEKAAALDSIMLQSCVGHVIQRRAIGVASHSAGRVRRN